MMSGWTRPDLEPPRRRSGAGRAALAALALAGILLPGFAAAPAKPSSPPQPWKKLSERETRYLERGLVQIRRMKGNFDWIGAQPLASGALAAAALAAEGRPDAASLRQEAARWTEDVLNGCPKWHTNACARSQLPLQRLVLQYPGALPPEILTRLRETLARTGAQPPGEALINFLKDTGTTENQRMISMSRSLVAQVVAGTPDSPAAKAWGAFAEGFLRAHERDGWYEAE